MTGTVETGYGADALRISQLIRFSQGIFVISGGEVTDGTADMEHDVAGGTILNGSGTESWSSTSVTLTAGGAKPRKDVIYYNIGTNAIEVAEGTQADAKPQGSVREDTYQPSPDDLSGVNGVPLAVVWVAADETDTAAADIEDRRNPLQRIQNSAVVALQNLGPAEAFNAYPLQNSDLVNSAITVAGNAVALGGSTGIDLADLATRPHSDLTSIGASDHHTRYADSEARAAVEGVVDAADLTGASGTNGQVLKTDGSLAAWEDTSGGGITVDFQRFTSSGTWNKPSGVEWVLVSVVGGGAGGGGGSSSQGGGGGGANAIYLFPADAISSSVSVTVGAGGASSTNGGESSFGDFVRAAGGLTNSSRDGGDGGGTHEVVSQLYEGGPGGNNGSPGNWSVFGGGGGSGCNDSSGVSGGGDSMWGGGGGGAGGDESGFGGPFTVGGGTQQFTPSNGSGPSTEGADGADAPDDFHAGEGGAGHGGSGDGGAGGIPGGGGGGSVSGNGGAGGRGEVRVWAWG